MAKNRKSQKSQQKSQHHDVHVESGGKWIQTFCVLVYAEVVKGDAVEVTRKDGTVQTLVVDYVMSFGYSEKEGKPFTKFLPVPEPKENREKVQKPKTADALMQVLNELRSIRSEVDTLKAGRR